VIFQYCNTIYWTSILLTYRQRLYLSEMFDKLLLIYLRHLVCYFHSFWMIYVFDIAIKAIIFNTIYLSKTCKTNIKHSMKIGISIDTNSITIELTLRVNKILFSYSVLWVTNCELRSKQEIWFMIFIWFLRFNKQNIALHFDYKFLNCIHFIVCKSVYYSISLFTETSTWLEANLRQMYWKWFKK
jgi:hypothetical protein